MARYQLFHRIHKGLRALLYDTGLLLQRTDFTIADESREAVNRLHFVVALFERYQASEDLYLLPAMMACEPGIASSFEEEHEEGYLLGKKLEKLTADFQKARLPLEQVAAGAEIFALFDEFILFNILHMGREEQVVTKILWRYYTDAELQKIAWKIVGESEPSFLSPYSKWMIRGLNNNEIVRWLKEVKHTAEERDFNLLLKTAEAELQPGRLNLLQDVLMTTALVA